MIIVEGPDGAGKTTLIERLEGQLGITREPRAVSSEAKSLVPIGHYIEDELRKGFGMRLYDRFALISSPMYMPLPNRTFRDEMLNQDWLMAHWVKMTRIDPLIILCLPPMADVVRNVKRDPHNKAVWDYIETIYLSYHNWYCAHHPFNPSIILWDYTNPNHQLLSNGLNWVKARIEKGRV